MNCEDECVQTAKIAELIKYKMKGENPILTDVLIKEKKRLCEKHFREIMEFFEMNKELDRLRSDGRVMDKTS